MLLAFRGAELQDRMIWGRTVYMAQLITMFVTIFVAELGDKTQIATLLFASERQNSPWIVFAASAGALMLGSALSVIMGAYGGRWLEHVPLKLIAGIGFILIGVFSVVQYYRGD
jgi:putative Ca2+/H+ antiporter (TMEM165/GDT1 family)